LVEIETASQELYLKDCLIGVIAQEHNADWKYWLVMMHQLIARPR
jgi:hypothetical protein